MGLASSTASSRYSSHPHPVHCGSKERHNHSAPCAAAIRKNRYRRTKCITIQADMESRVVVMVRGATSLCPASMTQHFETRTLRKLFEVAFHSFPRESSRLPSSASLQLSDVSRSAETARISLTENVIEEFKLKIRQVINWFGQLQDVDLQSVEPCIRADSEDSNSRDDVPEAFDKRDTMIAAVPRFEEPYIIKVPKVLNKEYSIYF